MMKLRRQCPKALSVNGLPGRLASSLNSLSNENLEAGNGLASTVDQEKTKSMFLTSEPKLRPMKYTLRGHIQISESSSNHEKERASNSLSTQWMTMSKTTASAVTTSKSVIKPENLKDGSQTSIQLADAEEFVSQQNGAILHTRRKPDVSDHESASPLCLEEMISETDETKLTENDDEYNRDVCIIETAKEARRIMNKLHEIVALDKDRVFACDTEVKNIDVSKESPKGHGEVTCFSIYCGSDVNFGTDPSEIKTHLWVDVLGKGTSNEEAKKVLQTFKPFFEDAKFIKIWHNYGFDRHVISNMGIRCDGFGGDTMHMARLWDSSRKGKGYTLESLSNTEELNPSGDASKKTSMKDLFGESKIKRDGTPGKAIVVPSIEELQLNPIHRPKWIHYSARDAKAAFDLYQSLKAKLMDPEQCGCTMDASVQSSYPFISTLWDFYQHVWLPFGDLLTEMEDSGIFVNVENLRKAQIQAEIDREEASKRFRSWADTRVKGAIYMNPSSAAQVRTMLFAGVVNHKTQKEVERFRILKIENPEYQEHLDEKRPGKPPRKIREVKVHGLWGDDKCPLHPTIFTASGWPAVSAMALKTLIGEPGVARDLLKKEYGEDVKDDILDLSSVPVEGEEEEGFFISDAEDTFNRNYEASQNGLGPLFSAFKERKEGLRACVAVEALIEISAIETLLSSFIIPLQEDEIKAADGRVHGSMNINTETGRLSCRRPNLQNQPTPEKDRYRVRQCFEAQEGNTLIVADYGQLELRILAHLTNCKSMLDAFAHGGDFHSRTAASMYDHIQEAISKGTVALEKGNNGHDVPLVKDVYASERRRAKVLNFSIAYGKTAHGLAKDWKVDIKEAERTLERWYADRQEVKKWQKDTIQAGKKNGYVTTLLGRRRNLPELKSSSYKQRLHAERAAINTPIQGSAADIATVAMLAIRHNRKLRDLGWKLLCQVHDEVILEGPEGSAEDAQKVVVHCMEHPFLTSDGLHYHNPLNVELTVDAKHAKTWYDAK